MHVSRAVSQAALPCLVWTPSQLFHHGFAAREALGSANQRDGTVLPGKAESQPNSPAALERKLLACALLNPGRAGPGALVRGAVPSLRHD